VGGDYKKETGYYVKREESIACNWLPTTGFVFVFPRGSGLFMRVRAALGSFTIWSWLHTWLWTWLMFACIWLWLWSRPVG